MALGGRRFSAAIALAVGVAVAGAPARGEEKPAHVVIHQEAKRLGEQLVLKLDMFDWRADDEHVFDNDAGGLGYAADLRLDLGRRRAHVSLGAGDPGLVYLRLDARLWPDHGSLRTALVLKVGIAGERLQLSLPDVRVKPRMSGGALVYELEVPLIEGRF